MGEESEIKIILVPYKMEVKGQKFHNKRGKKLLFGISMKFRPGPGLDWAVEGLSISNSVLVAQISHKIPF